MFLVATHQMEKEKGEDMLHFYFKRIHSKLILGLGVTQNNLYLTIQSEEPNLT